MPRSRRTSRASRLALRREFEPLEPRLVLSTTTTGIAGLPEVRLVGRTLTVEGTSGSDRISIGASRRADGVRVLVGGVLRSYEGVDRIVVRAGRGDDVVRVGGRVALPVRVDAGEGNDRIEAGAGPGVFLGGGGNDLLIGGASRAALDGGAGNDRVVLTRRLATISVGASAAGEALGVLSQGYRLQPLQASVATVPGPIVVGPGDLDDALVVPRLKAAYQAGYTVALTNATPGDAVRLGAIVGHDQPASWSADEPTAALVAYRQGSFDERPAQSETTVVMPSQASNSPRLSAASRGRAAGLRTFEWLSSVFSDLPAVADADPASQDLTNLATAYVTKSIGTNSAGDQVQIVNTVYGARSFLNQADYFYVHQEVDYHNSFYVPADSNIIGVANSTLTSPASPPVIIQPSPQTTLATTSVTSGVSTTIGGSIGFNESQGFNASISGSVTVSNSTTTTYPPIDIRNEGDLATGVTYWDWNNHADLPVGTLTFYNKWIWQIPFTAYASDQTSVTLTSYADLRGNEGGVPPYVKTTLISTVPTPFGDTFSLQTPQVVSLSSGTVKEGDTFTISGSGFYPSLVTSVLVGGQAIPAANYQVVNDTTVKVIAPDSIAFDAPVVVQTTQGFSNDDVTIDIYP